MVSPLATPAASVRNTRTLSIGGGYSLVDAIRTGFAERYKSTGERWITIGAHETDKGKRVGGTPVKIDGKGRIVAGPAGIAGKTVKSITQTPDRNERVEHEVKKAAKRHQIKRRDLHAAVKELHEHKAGHQRAREKAKAEARAAVGLTEKKIARIENDGLDFTSVKHFDDIARSFAAEHPELGFGGGYGDDSRDYSRQLWDFIREPSAPAVKRHDPKLIEEAAGLVKSGKTAAKKPAKPAEPTGDVDEWGDPITARAHDSEAVPFSRSRQNGLVERFALAFDESKHPRASDGKFGSGGGSSEQIGTGRGSGGPIEKRGERVYKQATGNESKVYEQLAGVAGIADGKTEGGKISTPHFAHVVSVDDLQPGKRHLAAPLVKAQLPQIVNAMTALSHAGYDYGDQLQVGLSKDRSAHVFDFSATTKSPDATDSNLNHLSIFLHTFGLPRHAEAVGRVRAALSYANDADSREFAEGDDDAQAGEELANGLDGKPARFAYYAFNARDIPGVAQTAHRNGSKVVASDKPLPQSFLDKWELMPAVHRTDAPSMVERFAKAFEDGSNGVRMGFEGVQTIAADATRIDEVSPLKAGYRPGFGPNRCETCTFAAPGATSCRVVSGPITPADVCNYYHPTAAAMATPPGREVYALPGHTERLDDTLGIEAERMPQLRGGDLPRFLAYLDGLGVPHAVRAARASTLYPTQSTVDPSKVAAIAETLGQPGASTSAPPALVSGDGYVIDGHHRLAAVQRIDPDGQIPIVQIEATLPDVLRHARDYLASPAAKSATGSGSDQKRLAELLGIA